ncbi:MAG: Coq4 family protein [Polyangiales bacterium]
MTSIEYRYSARPTRNPFRYLLAVWRLIRNDPEEMTSEAAIVEMGFARSPRGRRYARWEEAVESLKADPRTAPAMHARKAFGPIVLEDLEQLPEGTLGRVFADHCRARKIDPNLIHIPPTDEVGWFLNHLYQTHDIWHVLTGWGNDIAGEVGVAGFYSAQFGAPPFFGYMLALILLNTVIRRGNLREIFTAFSTGYQTGKRAQPLFGVDWNPLWDVPIVELRARFAIDQSGLIGEGIRAAA